MSIVITQIILHFTSDRKLFPGYTVQCNFKWNFICLELPFVILIEWNKIFPSLPQNFLIWKYKNYVLAMFYISQNFEMAYRKLFPGWPSMLEVFASAERWRIEVFLLVESCFSYNITWLNENSFIRTCRNFQSLGNYFSLAWALLSSDTLFCILVLILYFILFCRRPF